MVRKSTLVLVLFVIAGALTAVIGTGAFASVTASRTVAVNVAGDDSALLQLSVHIGPNGAFAQQSGGQLEILINGDITTAGGVNQNATTTLNDVFNITNQGGESLGIWIVKSGPHSGLVTFETANGSRLDDGSASADTLASGSTFEVTIVIDTTGQTLAANETLLSSITIHADSDQA